MLESGKDEEAGDREADPPGQWDVLKPDAHCEAHGEQHPGVPLHESLLMVWIHPQQPKSPTRLLAPAPTTEPNGTPDANRKRARHEDQRSVRWCISVKKSEDSRSQEQARKDPDADVAVPSDMGSARFSHSNQDPFPARALQTTGSSSTQH